MGAAVAPMRPVDSMVPNMLIQSVSRTDDRNAAIARLDANLAGELDELETEYQETLSDLRMSLIWLNLGTFGATFLGGSLLIGKRLSPLQRLSDAVSRVNEQNFDLSFDDTHLPRELVPIVARLRVTLSQLQSAFEREKRATADISHELRTPLAGLRTSLEVSLKRPRTPESYRETIKECIDIVGQLSQLVERLLTLAHLDAKTDAVHVESVDMASLAHQVGLVNNAVSYNRPGGKVQLVVEPAEAGMAISVSDTGQGIAPENLDRIFERFFRADPSRHDVGIHAGLGLSIVRAYVEQLGGRISVESELGKGSRFRVWLPELPLSHSYTDVVSDSELLRSSR
jgi:signal transduction histidine kinase